MDNDAPTHAFAPRPGMMIKGLVPSLPERGHVKIGIKGAQITSQKGNKFQPPQKLDHFIVTTMDRAADGNFKRDDEAHARLGNKPVDLPVRLLYDDPELNFPTRYACYVGRSLWCSGDGQIAMREDDQVKKTKSPVTCPCPRKEPGYEGRDKCKMNGNLAVLIDGVSGVGGVWKFRTTSFNTITGLMSTMTFIKAITGGPLASIPLNLIVRPKEGTAPDGSKVTIYVVGLEYPGDISQLQKIGHQIALERATTHISIHHIEDEARRLLLAAPVDVPLPGDDNDDTVDEFYSEQAVPAGPAPPRPTRTEFEQQVVDVAPQPTHPVTGELVDQETGELTTAAGERPEPGATEPDAEVDFAAWEQWSDEFSADLRTCQRAADVDALLADHADNFAALEVAWPDKAKALYDMAKERRGWAPASNPNASPDLAAGPPADVLAKKYGGPIKGIERKVAEAENSDVLEKGISGYGSFLGALLHEWPAEHKRILAVLDARRAALKGGAR